MTLIDNTRPPIRTGQQRVEEALGFLVAAQARIEREQHELRERQETILLALGLGVPDYAPVPHDPWADTEEMYTS